MARRNAAASSDHSGATRSVVANRRGWVLLGIALVVVTLLIPWLRSAVADRIGARAMTHHANLEYDEAVAQYMRAAWVDPGNWRWMYYRALVHLERGEAAPAADALRGVLEAEPAHAMAWWRLGEAEFKQARYAEADRAYARAENDPAVAAHARRGRARVALAAGQTPAAVERSSPSSSYRPPRDPLVDVLADRSSSSVFLLRQAAATDISRESSRREQLVRRALEVDPDNPDVVYEVGSLLQQLRRPGEALDYFNRHLDMMDDDQQTLVQIGKCYSDLGRLQEAEAALARALAISDDATGFYNLGFVMEQQGRAREAEAYYRRTLGVDPTHASANNNLAVLLAESGRLEEAMRHWSTVLRANPEHVDAHANVGAALAQRGQFAEALRHLDEALRLNPNHKSARANRDAVARAMKN
jgi:tetratricopeptide (TPR) repeat protein